MWIGVQPHGMIFLPKDDKRHVAKSTDRHRKSPTRGLRLVARLGASARLCFTRRVHRRRLLRQRIEEQQHVQTAFLTARNQFDDGRCFVRVDQVRRRRSAQCHSNGFQVTSLIGRRSCVVAADSALGALSGDGLA